MIAGLIPIGMKIQIAKWFSFFAVIGSIMENVNFR